jgi:Uma2 family endonuclease
MRIPPFAERGRVTMNLGTPIDVHVKAQDLGTVFAAETGFLLARDPDTVRAPDVAFLRADREPTPERGYFPGAPDLAVEVLSPDDRPGYVRDKVAEWLEAGALAVWVVDPRARSVTVHEPGRSPTLLGASDTLDGGDVLPGLTIDVGEIFA